MTTDRQLVEMAKSIRYFIGLLFMLASCLIHSYIADDIVKGLIDCDSVAYTHRLFYCEIDPHVEETGNVTIERIHGSQRTRHGRCFINHHATPSKSNRMGIIVEIPGDYIVTLKILHLLDFETNVKVMKTGYGPISPPIGTTFFHSGAYTFKVEGVDSNQIHWEVFRSFYILDSDQACFDLNHFGRVDVSVFMSHRCFRQADFFYYGNQLTMPSRSLPVGMVIIHAHFPYKGKTHTQSAFYKVNFNPTKIKLNPYLTAMITSVEPAAKSLPWSPMSDFVIDVSKTFSTHLTKESGFVLPNPEQHLKFYWSCVGSVCSKINEEKAKVLRIKKDFLEQHINTTFRITFLAILNTVGKGMERPKVKIVREIHITDLKWPHMEIRCIRNCYDEDFMATTNRQLMFYCPDCTDHRSYNITVLWSLCPNCSGYYSLVSHAIPAGERIYNVTVQQTVKGKEYKEKYALSIHKDSQSKTGRIQLGNVSVDGLALSIRVVNREDELDGTDDYIFFYNAIWKFNDSLLGNRQIEVLWYATFNWVVDPMLLNFQIFGYNPIRPLLPWPELRVRSCQRFYCHDWYTLDYQVDDFPDAEPNIDHHNLRQLVRDKSIWKSNIYGFRTHWLLLKAAESLPGADTTDIKQSILENAVLLLKKRNSTYTDSKMVLDLILAMFQLKSMIVSPVHKKFAVGALQRVVDQMFRWIDDEQGSQERMECKALETVIKIFKTFTPCSQFNEKPCTMDVLAARYFIQLYRDVARHVTMTADRSRMCHNEGDEWHLKTVDLQIKTDVLKKEFPFEFDKDNRTILKVGISIPGVIEKLQNDPEFVDLRVNIAVSFKEN